MTDATANSTSSTVNGPVIVDLGKKKSKAIKRLKRGEGALMDDVNKALAELSSSGVVSNGASPVVVIVEKKPQQVWDTWM